MNWSFFYFDHGVVRSANLSRFVLSLEAKKRGAAHGGDWGVSHGKTLKKCLVLSTVEAEPLDSLLIVMR